MEACFFSSIFYSCETWFDHRLGKLNTLYLGGIKTALGVRESCPTTVALIESGYPRLQALLKERQYRFYRKIISNRSHLQDDPQMKMISVARSYNTPAARYIDQVLSLTTTSFIKKTQRSYEKILVLKKAVNSKHTAQ